MGRSVPGRSAVVVALGFLFLLACDDDGPTVVRPAPTPSPTPPPSQQPSSLSLDVVYERVGSTTMSADQYVFHGDGTFRLRFITRAGFHDLLGTYSGSVGSSSLAFDASSSWEATLTVDGDCVTVSYSATMALSDFEGGEFCRVTGNWPWAEGHLYERVEEYERLDLARTSPLPDAGPFRLLYLDWTGGLLAYPGTYSREGARFDFDFDASSTAGPWHATGTVEDDCIVVEYNDVMQFSGFTNGSYCLLVKLTKETG